MLDSQTQLTIEVVDNRGSVVVAVEGGARFAGTLRRIPEVFEFGTRLDVNILIGDEPVALALRTMSSADVTAGVVVGAVVVQFDLGGVDLVPRPTVAVSNSTSDGVGLSGDIGEVPMAELVQLLCATRRTAEVELRHLGRFLGTLNFADGRAVNARTVDDVVGVDAFYALAGLEIGAFSVRYNRSAADENLTGDTLFLLLEAARRVDEARRGPDDDGAFDDDENTAAPVRPLDNSDVGFSEPPMHHAGEPISELGAAAVAAAMATPPPLTPSDEGEALTAVRPAMAVATPPPLVKSSTTPPPLPKRNTPPPMAAVVAKAATPPAAASSSSSPKPSSSKSSSSSSSKSSSMPQKKRERSDRTIEQPRQTADSIGRFSGFFAEFSQARAQQVKSREETAVKSSEGTAVEPDDVVEERPATAIMSLKPDFADMADKDTDIVGREAATAAE
ncbi:MAG TPA: DUF4388 domain-containing protein [Myxococcota bacterium]